MTLHCDGGPVQTVAFLRRYSFFSIFTNHYALLSTGATRDRTLKALEKNELKARIYRGKQAFTGDQGSECQAGHGSRLQLSCSTGFLGKCAQY
jgi:hypothetical protein